jgi:hypothetical protein
MSMTLALHRDIERYRWLRNHARSAHVIAAHVKRGLIRGTDLFFLPFMENKSVPFFPL